MVDNENEKRKWKLAIEVNNRFRNLDSNVEKSIPSHATKKCAEKMLRYIAQKEKNSREEKSFYV